MYNKTIFADFEKNLLVEKSVFRPPFFNYHCSCRKKPEHIKKYVLVILYSIILKRLKHLKSVDYIDSS